MNKYFKVSLNKPALSYKVGEKIEFTVYAMNNLNKVSQSCLKWQLTTDDGKNEWGYASTSPAEPFKVETVLTRPGFARLHIDAMTDDTALLPGFDPLDAGAGADVEKIPYADEIPEDFDEFWGKIEKDIAEHDVKFLKMTPYAKPVPEGYDCYNVRISTPYDTVASGCISIPKNAADNSCKIRIGFMGYGVAGAAPSYAPNTIYVVMNAHGIDNQDEITRAETWNKNKHLLNYGFNDEENKDPNTCYWKNMMVRNLCALKAVKTLPQWDKKHIIAAGGSQGALQATTLAAHSEGVTLLDLSIPWFCNIAAETKGYLQGWRPKFQEGLRYFDTVAQGSRVKCPVKILAGLGDYVCPPHSVMALYNNITTKKSIKFRQARTHPYEPPFGEKEYEIRSGFHQNGDEIKIGKYRHYKGNEYEVIGLARHSETDETLVVYRALYGDGEIWTRPAAMWNECVVHNYELVNRFTYIGE